MPAWARLTHLSPVARQVVERVIARLPEGSQFRAILVRLLAELDSRRRG